MECPVGYGFRPRDYELVGHYLKHKLLGDDSSVHNVIAEVDVCKFEPWDLPAYSKIKSDDPEWLFFSPLSLKFRKSTRCNRKTKTGYWKVTGKDRNIMTRGSDKVIGTKKTLVFYKSCGGHRVKTNWVIHEYHATTFPDDKRGYVLCRLMEKAEKKAEGGADSLIHNDEGEPSSHNISDYENQPTTDRIPDVYTPPEVNLESFFLPPPQSDEYDFSLLQQSPIVIEQEPYFQDSTFPNAYFGNENNIMQSPFETTEDEDNLDKINEFWHSFITDEDEDNLDKINEFWHSFITDEDLLCHEEIIPSFANDSTPSQSLRKEYHESFETEAEPLSARHGNVLNSTSTVCDEDTGSRENPVMSMVKSSHDSGPSPVSSKNEVNLEKKDSTFDGDDFWEVNAFGSTTNETCFPMFLIESVSTPYPPRARSPSPSRKCKSKYRPARAHRTTPRSQGKSQVEKTVSQQQAQKETHILESNIEQRKAQGTSSRKNLETKSNQSSAVNRKGSFTNLETPLSVNNAVYNSPPSLSSKNEVNLEIKDNTSDDGFWGVDADEEPIPNEPLYICVLGADSSPSPPRPSSPSSSGRCQSKYHPISHNFVSLRATTRRSQTHRNISSQAVSQQEELKESHIIESNKKLRKAQGTSSRKKLETSSNVPSGVIGKGSFIHLETPLVQRSWFFFTRSCALSWPGFEFHHDMMHKLKFKGVS